MDYLIAFLLLAGGVALSLFLRSKGYTGGGWTAYTCGPAATQEPLTSEEEEAKENRNQPQSSVEHNEDETR